VRASKRLQALLADMNIPVLEVGQMGLFEFVRVPEARIYDVPGPERYMLTGKLLVRQMDDVLLVSSTETA
jgi:hypothetical protein